MEKILLESIFNTARDKKIIIIGDIMLDRYLLGSVNRISPEAPVQVFDIEKNEYKLGGAANVCYNVKKLGANPILIGLIGDDPEGLIVKTLMENLNLDTKGLVTEDKRPTTCKTRIIAAAHHLLRIDSESKTDINTNTETIILTKLKEILNDDDIIIVQDYNKGLLTEKLIQKIMETSKEMNARVLVDPKFENFYSYKDAYLFKPNRKELEDASGKKAKNTDEAKALGLDLIRKINCRHLVLT
jgi:rfaE bifunctional protein kinase chain/domain